MPIDLSAYRLEIESQLAALDAALRQAAAGAGTVELDQSSVGRLSRMDALQQQAMAQGMMERMRTRRRRLEAALRRIDDGSFGACCECGSELDEARLLQDPAAVFCADCMTERELRG